LTSPPSDDTLHALLEDARRALAEGDHRQGLDSAEQAREQARATGGRPLANALSLEGQLLWRLGRFEDAAVAAREAVPLWARLDDPAGHADALSLLAVAYTELGLHEEGLRCATQAFEIARAEGLVRAGTLALNRIGICHERLGDPAQGERFLLQALSRAREERNFDDTLQALNNLMANTLTAHAKHERAGELEAAQQALARARQHGAQAMAMAQRDGGPYRLAVTQSNLAEVLSLAGEYERAQALLQDTVSHCEAQGFRAVALRSRRALGELRLQQGRHEEALTLLHDVLDALRHDRDMESTRRRVQWALYRSYKALGRFEAALAHCEAHHEMEMQRAALQAQAQARLMVNRLDMEQALMMADRALMDAARERIEAGTLEAEKRDLEQRTQALHRDAHEDALTGLHNRGRVERELPLLLAQMHEQGRPLQLAVLDVDHFKQVNDCHGHAVGDQVLRQVAHLLADRLRTRDLAARLGGEEFLVALVDTPREAGLEICERLRQAIQQHDWSPLGDGLAVTISIGVAELRDGDDPATLSERADASLYRAKRDGRNRVHSDAS
jgi:diguanylate cyclase (GGDEF)-like protein